MKPFLCIAIGIAPNGRPVLSVDFDRLRKENFPSSFQDARRIQDELKQKLLFSQEDCAEKNTIHLIGGIDVGYNTEQNIAHAVCVIMSIQDLEILEIQESFVSVVFPYVTGYLSFREIPAILDVLEKIKIWPDIFMVDGHGIAHPRQMGIASHLGVLLDFPCFGVAKKKLVGHYDPVGSYKGDYSILNVKKNQSYSPIGFVLRTKENIKPVFLSLGHRVTLPVILEITLACLKGYKLPEPTRIADKMSKIKRL